MRRIFLLMVMVFALRDEGKGSVKSESVARGRWVDVVEGQVSVVGMDGRLWAENTEWKEGWTSDPELPKNIREIKRRLIAKRT